MKRLLHVLLAAALVCAAPALALAESRTGKTWNVTYTTAGKLEDDYSSQEYADQISQLEPGDDITMTVKLDHQNATSADWYLRNDVIKTLEDASNAAGSAYTYKLTYQGASTNHTLFDSTVGGDTGAGLHDADDGNYIYLDNLSTGKSGTVTLYVALDGETEGNVYFDTLAQIKLAFAVEPNTSSNSNEQTNTTNGDSNRNQNQNNETRRGLVRTGEENRLFPFYVAMLVSGLLFAALAVVSFRERKKEEEEAIR